MFEEGLRTHPVGFAGSNPTPRTYPYSVNLNVFGMGVVLDILRFKFRFCY